MWAECLAAAKKKNANDASEAAPVKKKRKHKEANEATPARKKRKKADEVPEVLFSRKEKGPSKKRKSRSKKAVPPGNSSGQVPPFSAANLPPSGAQLQLGQVVGKSFPATPAMRLGAGANNLASWMERATASNEPRPGGGEGGRSAGSGGGPPDGEPAGGGGAAAVGGGPRDEELAGGAGAAAVGGGPCDGELAGGGGAGGGLRVGAPAAEPSDAAPEEEIPDDIDVEEIVDDFQPAAKRKKADDEAGVSPAVLKLKGALTGFGSRYWCKPSTGKAVVEEARAAFKR